MNPVVERAKREIVENPCSRFIILDPAGWLQDPTLPGIFKEYDVTLISAGEFSEDEYARVASTVSSESCEANQKFAIIVGDSAYADEWMRRLACDMSLIDMQPSTVFPTLDPQMTRLLSLGQAESLLDEYGWKGGSIRGVSQTAAIILKELFDLEPKGFATPDDLVRTAFRIHVAGLSIPRNWLFVFRDRMPSHELLGFEPTDVLVDPLSFVHAMKRIPGEAAISNLIRSGPLRDFIATGDDDLLPQIDINIIQKRIEEVRWEEIGLASWLENLADLTQLAIAEEMVPSSSLASLRQYIDRCFRDRLQNDYFKLQQAPWHHSPMMVHRVLDFICSRHPSDRVALFVVDCLSMPMWFVIGRSLRQMGLNPSFEGATFAWIPTLTSVSRQSLLSGKIPIQFSDSIMSTSREESLWQAYWSARELQSYEVRVLKSAENNMDAVLESAEEADLKRAAIVFGDVDNLVHASSEAGTLRFGDLLRSLNQTWTKEVLSKSLRAYLDHGWIIYLTSDHGSNRIRRALPNPREGVLVESTGQRARVYPRASFAAMTKAEGMRWDGKHTLPDDYVVVLAESGAGYGVSKGWGHGGCAWDEVIVPFVRFGGETN